MLPVMEKPSVEQRLKWLETFSLDGDGVPTSVEARMLLRFLFEHRSEALNPQQISDRLLGLHPDLVRIMCRQFQLIFLVIQDPEHSERFKYDVRSPNVKFQAKVETALLDTHINE